MKYKLLEFPPLQYNPVEPSVKKEDIQIVIPYTRKPDGTIPSFVHESPRFKYVELPPLKINLETLRESTNLPILVPIRNEFETPLHAVQSKRLRKTRKRKA